MFGKIIFLFVCVKSLVAQNSTNQTNYIVDGDFENPVVPGWTLKDTSYTWKGKFQYIGILYPNAYFGYGQYIDLGYGRYYNGYVQQTFLVPFNGTFEFSYLYLAGSVNYQSYIAEVYWNGDLIDIAAPISRQVTKRSLLINLTEGNHTLKFLEVGNDSDSWGLFLDEITLYSLEPQINNTQNNCTGSNCTENGTILNQTNYSNPNNDTLQNGTTLNQTNSSNDTTSQTNNSNGNNTSVNQTNQIDNINQNIDSTQNDDEVSQNWMVEILAGVLNMPLNQFPSFKYFIFFVEDMWLYSYHPRQYQGLVNQTFSVVISVEKMKFDLISKVVDVDSIIDELTLSDYSAYTQPKFMDIQTSDTVLLKVLLTFFMFNIPINIIFCFIFYWIFRALMKYKVSTIFRRYYFFGAAFFQITFEGNISYFAFCCFNHLGNSFSFKFVDKAALIFTILFLITVLFISVSYYFVIGKLLKKKACYFIYCFYRCPQSYWYLAIYNMLIEFVKGFLHYYYLDDLSFLIGSLCGLELFIIVYTIYMQKIHQIFITKTMFTGYISYHLCFIVLNISLFIEQYLKQNGTVTSWVINIQQGVMISLMILNGLMIIFDFIPLQYVKSKKKPLKEKSRIYDQRKIGKMMYIYHPEVNKRRQMIQPQYF